MRITRENYRLFLKPFIGTNIKEVEINMKPRYRLCTHPSWWVEPYYIAKKENGFWQQISPNYFRKGNAIRYAKRNNITLENN